MLQDKVAIITGASRGIGFATALKFLENGAKVAVLGKGEEGVKAAVEEIKKINANYEVVGYAPELHKFEEVREVFKKVKEQFGKIDILMVYLFVLKKLCLI